MPQRTPTIEAALREHAVDRDVVAARYPGPSRLVRRILGVLPRAVSTLEIWPPALVTYNVMVPAFFDVPKSDIGLGISPELRAMVAHAASRSFGCQYCSAHTAVMGTIVSGPLDALRVTGRVAAVRRPGELTTPERVAVEYAGAVATIPSGLTTDGLEALVTAHKRERVEAIALVVAAMGYLNRFMDATGVSLEASVRNAVGELAAGGWTAGKHDNPETAREDAERGEDAAARPSRLGLIRELPAAIAYETRALAAVPASPSAQDNALREALGFVPYYVPHVQRRGPRRVFVHMLLERLHPSGVDVDRTTKYLMAWVHARTAGNHVLAAHFAFTAHRSGASVGDLVDALVPPPAPRVSAKASALALAHATAGTSGVVPADVIDALTTNLSPAGVVELLSVLSIVCAMQRYTATFVPDVYEPEIGAFVGEHGDTLELPARP
jgi:alkylhydroperoxidase family enzyme